MWTDPTGGPGMARHSAASTSLRGEQLAGSSTDVDHAGRSATATDEEHDSGAAPAEPSTASAALEALAATCRAAGVVEVSLDVADLDLTDRASLHALVVLAGALRSRGGRMVLVGLSTERLVSALRAASLTEVFVLWETLREDRRGRRADDGTAARATTSTVDSAGTDETAG
jgi:anti-anti-sigma regulatory factor